MSRLIEEITGFLEGKEVVCGREVRDGFEVVRALAPGRAAGRIIIPLEIKATSADKAIAEAEVEYGAISKIKEAEGYPLIITEDRWQTQGDMTRARLLAHLEIFEPLFARNCEVRRIDKSEARNFLTANHSYGYAACRYHYGLYTKKHNQLAAVATFSNARKWVKGDREIRSYEWTRYASLPDMRISGGMGKLLKAFIKDVSPDDIMSYADLEWSEGLVYETLGFVSETGKGPVLFSVNPETWQRTALRTIPTSGETQEDALYFRNFGSAKYRLKLTDYE